MDFDHYMPRSPELLSADDSALLVVDVQEKLIGLIPDHEHIVWNIRRLLDAAAILDIPVAATEQYPKGLGPTVSELAKSFDKVPEKLLFSCRECESIFQDWSDRGIRNILVVGIETHVCVQQTVFDLMASGFRVYIATDALGARGRVDHNIAIRRMDSAGATITTTEASMFEWCEAAGTPQFKAISKLVQQQPPE